MYVIDGTLLDAKYDRLFKDIISAEWCVKSDGHVESPQGYFAIVEIPEHLGELKDMQDAVEEGQRPFTDWPESGWYFTTEDSDGMIRVYKSTETKVKYWFVQYECAFADWDEY